MLLAPAGTASAHANKWTLFPSTQIDFTSPPASFSTIANQASGIPYNVNVNSMHDKATGNLIFSVSEEGIFNAGGGKVQSFQSLCNGRPEGEIEILPIPSECNSYYVVYWHYTVPHPSCGTNVNTLDLVAWKVNWNGTSLTVTAPIVVGSAAPPPTMFPGYATLVTDAIDINTGLRDIYTLDGTNLSRVTMDASGNFGPLTMINSSMTPAISDLMELAKYNGQTYIAYSAQTTAPVTRFVEVYEIATATSYPIPFGNNEKVTGIEYVPDIDLWYIAYYDQLNAFIGGINTYDPFATIPYSFAHTITGSLDFKNSDLELAKDGNLYTVGYNYTFGTYGNLGVVNRVAQTVGYVMNGGSYIPISSTHTSTNNPWYLQNQIDVEDYDMFYGAPQGNKDFSYAGWPRIDMSNPFSLCPIQEICQPDLGLFNFLPTPSTTPPISYNQKYRISWTEISSTCGALSVGGGPLDCVGPWVTGPAWSENLLTYGCGTLGTLSALDKYFSISVEYEDCGGITSSPLGLFHIINSEPSYIAKWEINVDATGSNWSLPSQSCFALPFVIPVCGNNPTIKILHTGTYINSYYLVIKDYGTVCGSNPPVAVFNGSSSPVNLTKPYSPGIIVNLDAYINTYCSGPSNYFSVSPSNFVGVEVFANTGCGYVSVGEEYFNTNVACKDGQNGVDITKSGITPMMSTNSAGSLSTNEMIRRKLNLAVVPNPANTYAQVRFNLERKTSVSIRIIDATGRTAVEPIETTLDGGSQSVRINTENLAAGIYQVHVKTSEGSFTTNLSVIK